jgi:23S rRNA (guanine745-N1)-methyltransferase
MPFIPHDSLTCPIDDLPLQYRDGSLSCPSGHQYDIGRPGYANLLSVQHKRTKAPGDSKDMVRARNAFLAKGYYEPVAKLLAQLLKRIAGDELTVVDAGCGEGYYLEAIDSRAGKQLHLVGFDISKWAIQQAARRCAATWLVASNKRVPLADKSADVVLDMFGFPDFDSFQRILKTNGRLFCVTPAAQHLIELRKIIYPHVKQARGRDYPVPFTLVSRETLTFGLTLAQQDLENLLAMTPHLYRAPKEGLARLKSLKQLEITVDVNIDELRLHL